MPASQYLYESATDSQYSPELSITYVHHQSSYLYRPLRKYFAFTSAWLIRKGQLLNMYLTGWRGDLVLEKV